MNPNTPTRFQAVMKQIWPTIYKIINNTLYFLIDLLRSAVKIAIEQIKNGGS